MRISIQRLTAAADQSGFALWGCLDIETVLAALEAEKAHLLQWQQAGFAGEMKYMLREPELLADPRRLLPQAKAFVSLAAPYLPDSSARSFPEQPGFGRVARYAWGADYHQLIKRRVEQFIALLESELYSRIAWRGFTDAVPVLERAVGRAAGLGFIGRNSMLIRPGVGSYFFLADVLLDAAIEVEPLGLENRRKESYRMAAPGTACGKCFSCRAACPTAAIAEDGVIDSRRCISYLTIEKREEFSDTEAAALGDWIFGCDVCQEVCPFNHASIKGGAVKEPTEPLKYLKLSDVLALKTTAQFEAKFRGTALLRAGRPGLIRNALAVAVNQGRLELVDAVILLKNEDKSSLIHAEAQRTLRRLLPLSEGGTRRKILADIDGEL